MNTQDVTQSLYDLAVYLTGDASIVEGRRETLAQIAAHIVSGSHLATQEEAEAGSNNVKFMTPLRVAQAITNQGGGGGSPFFSFNLDAACPDATDLVIAINTAMGIPGTSTLIASFAIGLGDPPTFTYFLHYNGLFEDGTEGSLIRTDSGSTIMTSPIAITFPLALGTKVTVFGVTITPTPPI